MSAAFSLLPTRVSIPKSMKASDTPFATFAAIAGEGEMKATETRWLFLTGSMRSPPSTASTYGVSGSFTSAAGSRLERKDAVRPVQTRETSPGSLLTRNSGSDARRSSRTTRWATARLSSRRYCVW